MKKICLGLLLILSIGFSYAKPIEPDVEENNIQIFFLSPLKQKNLKISVIHKLAKLCSKI